MRFNTLKGAALGASLVYFLDPIRGRDRRAAVSQRAVSYWRAALASRPVRVRADRSNRGRATQVVVHKGRRRLLWWRAASSVPAGWEYPMTTVHIDVDDRFALPDLGLQAASRRTKGASRGFTRSPRGTTWAFPGAGATGRQ